MKKVCSWSLWTSDADPWDQMNPALPKFENHPPAGGLAAPVALLLQIGFPVAKASQCRASGHLLAALIVKLSGAELAVLQFSRLRLGFFLVRWMMRHERKVPLIGGGGEE